MCLYNALPCVILRLLQLEILIASKSLKKLNAITDMKQETDKWRCQVLF